MNKIVMACGFVACLPLACLANENVDIDKELNGLNIETSISGTGGGAGPATGGSGGSQVLEVTNNDTVTVVCQLQPAPSETATEQQRASIEPGEHATLRLDSGYASATTRATLSCEEGS